MCWFFRYCSIHHPPSECDQIGCFNRLDLYLKSPDSGERQYKSKT